MFDPITPSRLGLDISGSCYILIDDLDRDNRYSEHLGNDSRSPRPTTFNPHRYSGEDPCPDPRNFVFGFGRSTSVRPRRQLPSCRVPYRWFPSCSGESFAESLVFLSDASIISCLDIRRAIVDGRGVEPCVNYPLCWAPCTIRGPDRDERQCLPSADRRCDRVRGRGALDQYFVQRCVSTIF